LFSAFAHKLQKQSAHHSPSLSRPHSTIVAHPFRQAVVHLDGVRAGLVRKAEAPSPLAVAPKLEAAAAAPKQRPAPRAVVFFDGQLEVVDVHAAVEHINAVEKLQQFVAANTT